MPHPAVVAAAVSASVGALVAFELTVFKPWREDNWPHGVKEGLRHEWEAFKNDLHDISGGQDQRRRRRRREELEEEEEEAAALRQEMDDFEMHERDSRLARQNLTREFEQATAAGPPTRSDGSESLYANYTEAIQAARSSNGHAYIVRKRRGSPKVDDQGRIANQKVTELVDVDTPHGHVQAHSAHHELGSTSPSNSIATLISDDAEGVVETPQIQEPQSFTSNTSMIIPLTNATEERNALHFVSPPESLSNWTEAETSSSFDHLSPNEDDQQSNFARSDPFSSPRIVRQGSDSGDDNESWEALSASRPSTPSDSHI